MSQAKTQADARGHYFTEVRIAGERRQELLERAREWSDELGALNGSIENGDGNVAGKYGELVLAELLGADIVDHYEYDLVRAGVSIDVKSKRRTVAPKPKYEASIPDWNTEQGCDVYYFVSVREEVADGEPFSVVDLCGFMPPSEYYERATYHEEGERDEDNGFVFKTDCYNLPYSELRRTNELGEVEVIAE